MKRNIWVCYEKITSTKKKVCDENNGGIRDDFHLQQFGPGSDRREHNELRSGTYL